MPERAGQDAAARRFNKNADRKAAFTLLSSMYDTGELRVVERDAGHAVVELLNFALPTREICDTFDGYPGRRATRADIMRCTEDVQS